MPPSQYAGAAAELFDLIVATVAERTRPDERANERPDERPDEAEPLIPILLARALNQRIMMSVREAAADYGGLVIDKVHQAQVDERKHLGRELHDRIGAMISVALRDLELYRAYNLGQPETADDRVAAALDALREAMCQVRGLIAEIRRPSPLGSLRSALRNYLAQASDGATASKVILNGDEIWAPPATREEVFLVLREAVRNALAHGQARTLVVRVDITPQALRAMVDDDGVGFDPAKVGTCGIGLQAMRERVGQLGGRITVSSLPRHGTHVRVLIPLPGVHHGDEQ